MSARVIHFERHGRWAAALRRHLAISHDEPLETAVRKYLPNDVRPDIRIRETRSMDECWAELAKHPSSILILELTSTNAEGLLLRVARLSREHYRSRAIIVGERSMASWESVSLEAGAVAVFFTPREFDRIVQLVRAHFAALPRSAASIRDRVMAAIPWKAAPEKTSNE